VGRNAADCLEYPVKITAVGKTRFLSDDAQRQIRGFQQFFCFINSSVEDVVRKSIIRIFPKKKADIVFVKAKFIGQIPKKDLFGIMGVYITDYPVKTFFIL
jgi:hypothetical protein